MIVLDSITLQEFVWANRFGYSPWVSSHEFALDGALHIETAKKQAGRSIILTSDSEPLSVFTALEAHAEATGATPFQLTINSEIFSVIWDNSATPISGTPLIDYSDADPDYIADITLKLITV